jgi:hypothetical protein
VTAVRTDFAEASAQSRTVKVPLSHLSIELGHFYMEDFRGGEGYLQNHFERVRPWADVAKQELPGNSRGTTPRVSTCFMVDDYFTRHPTLTPATVLPEMIRAAEQAGVPLDYIGRESACASAGGVELAELVQGRLVPDPPPGSNGHRPSVLESGWLCNGQRSPETAEAMRSVGPWQPPEENGARNHSIFLDVELRGQGRWSCSYLAAVWQLLRLGQLRDHGRPVAEPQDWDPAATFPDSWDDLPPIIRINPRAMPFCAYRTVSIMDGDFLSIESAVRTILGRVDVDAEVRRQILERSRSDCTALPLELVERLSYVFLPATKAG